MKITVREVSGVNILDFSGSLDTNTSQAAEDEVNGLIAAGNDKILFNFKDLDYISSSGLRVLLATAKKLKLNQGLMKVCSLNPVVQEVFDISGFAGILSLASDEAEALALF
jgi:anti-sigma B factor antagonist